MKIVFYLVLISNLVSCQTKNKTMNEKVFWELITIENKKDQSNQLVENHLQVLKNKLATYPEASIVDFEKIFRKQLIDLLDFNVLALYEALNPSPIMKKDGKEVEGMEDYVSPDGFLYFRCWVLMQGKDFVKVLKDNPENLDAEERDFTNNWCEGMLYISEEVLQEKNSEIDLYDEIPVELDYDSGEHKATGEQWKIKDFEIKFPKLAKKFAYKRAEIDMGDFKF